MEGDRITTRCNSGLLLAEWSSGRRNICWTPRIETQHGRPQRKQTSDIGNQNSDRKEEVAYARSVYSRSLDIVHSCHVYNIVSLAVIKCPLPTLAWIRSLHAPSTMPIQLNTGRMCFCASDKTHLALYAKLLRNNHKGDN